MAKQSNKSVITAQGLRKYEEELKELKTVKRQEIARRIKAAREMGDLSENADYDAAKDEQTGIEKRILEIENILRNSEAVAEEEFDPARVNVGCTVRLMDKSREREVSYTIVGSSEADILHSVISNESPVGAALMGHGVGDLVAVVLPGGKVSHFEILDIQRAE